FLRLQGHHPIHRRPTSARRDRQSLGPITTRRDRSSRGELTPTAPSPEDAGPGGFPRRRRHEGDPPGRSSDGATPSARNHQGPSQEEEDGGHGGYAKDVDTGVWERIVDVDHDVRHTLRAG